VERGGHASAPGAEGRKKNQPVAEGTPNAFLGKPHERNLDSLQAHVARRAKIHEKKERRRG